MTSILPPGVSVLLVRLALIREREARDFARAGCHAHADASAREARQCRDVIAAHDEALTARAVAAEARIDLRRMFPADMEGVA
jgi:hypothetical protein